MKKPAKMWSSETQILRRWAFQYEALALGIFTCGTLCSGFFLTALLLFNEPFSHRNLADVFFLILMALLCGGIALFTGFGTTLLFTLFEWSFSSKMQPDSFSALSISAAMIPLGFMFALAVGFSFYPGEFWINATFIGPIVFGAIFAVLFARRFTPTDGVSQRGFRFDLRAMFVLTGWVAVGLVVAPVSLIIPFLLAICVSVSVVVVLISRFIGRDVAQQNEEPKPRT